jgi:Fe-S-cluster-containing dehydrogenase component/formate-dependent nitrite reductase membrane component NrfD
MAAMQLGFIIDQSRCIGCHACTVACKSENDVPLGDFRTWVKYTESGSFPQVKRSFTVLRCNQCTAAPCVEICPVTALHKRPDGIVDIDSRVCIGCKGCMQACPYDALYINEELGTAQKCHFCAHRTEMGLAPACAVVCPTEAIIPGDFDDPNSVVSRLRREQKLHARKLEAGTGPNVFYKAAHPAGLDPSLTNTSGGFLWSDQKPGPQLDAQLFENMEKKASSRTVYDVHHEPLWGWKVSAYLFTKSLAAGLFLAPALCLGPEELLRHPAIIVLALAFLTLTTGFLVGDLKRPERFLLVLLRPQWKSWLCKGAVVLTAYGLLLTTWLGLALLHLPPPPGLLPITLLAAALTAMYTAWLFGQAKGRVLWLRRGLAGHLLVQGWIAGCGLMLLLSPFMGVMGTLAPGLALGLIAHLLFTLSEEHLPPKGRAEEFRRAARLVTHGPYARSHWILGVGAGVLVPLALLFLLPATLAQPVAALLVLAGLYSEEDTLVRAGQALPIS